MSSRPPAARAGTASSGTTPGTAWKSTTLVFLLALVLRGAAARGDFWLDEIWSWMAVRDRVHGLGDVFFSIQHEANHIINSLWIYALGLDVDWRWYRLPAVLAGSVAVLVARQLLARAGHAAQWFVSVLSVPSFLLVNYASEARGYGVLMLCALASVWSVDCRERACRENRPRAARAALLGFWLAAMTGTLAHASYGATLAAVSVWYGVRLSRSAAGWRLALQRFLTLLGPPLAFAAWLWATNFLHVTIGGGPVTSAWQAAASVCSLALGGPAAGDWVWPLAAAAIGALALEVWLLQREGDDRALLWLALLLVPAVPLAAGVHSQYIYPRFFLGSAVFLLVALASLGARGWRHGGAPRLLACGVLAVITLGNLIGVARLVRDGRGQPAAAVRWMAAHSHGARIVVATDHAFRHAMTLDFYTRLLRPDQRFEILLEPPWPAPGPEWILRQDVARDWRPAPALHDADGRAYQLEALYPHAGLSGFTLALYHRRDEPAAAAPR